LRSDVPEALMPQSAGDRHGRRKVGQRKEQLPRAVAEMRESGGSFYTANVRSMESCLFGQGFLRPTMSGA
jgi:hypothetical protein